MMNTTRFALSFSLVALLALPGLTQTLPADAVGAMEGQASTAAPLTLSQAIATALERQPQIAAATANRQASEQRLKQTKATYLPTVTPTYNYQNQYTKGLVSVFQGGGVVTQLPAGRTTTTRQEQISLSYNVWDSGRRDLNARQARQNLQSSELGEANTRQTIVGNVANTYYGALRADALVKVSASQVERAKSTLDQIKAQVELGVSAKKDILQSEADYLNAQVNLLQAQNNAEVAHTQLRNAMGITGAGRLALAEVGAPTEKTPITVQVNGVAPGTDSSQAVKLLVASAHSNRPDIQQGQTNAAVSATTVQLAKVNTKPVLSANVAAGIQLDAANDPTREVGNNRSVTLNLTYPLYDGGASRANVHAAEATQRASEAQLNNQKLQVALEVEQAWRTLEQARATLPASSAAQQAARTNYDAARESFRLGAGSLIEIIQAQTALVQAETNYVQAIYNFYSADAALARAIGQAERIGRASGSQ